MVTKTTLDNTTTGKLVAMVSGITDQAKSVVRDLDPINDLRFLRLRSNKTEILIAPGKNISSRNFSKLFFYFILDEDYTLIVLQTPPAE